MLALLSVGLSQPVLAWEPDGAWPPVGVFAVWTDEGTLVTWERPEGGAEPTGFTVYRLDDIAALQWTAIGTTPGDVVTYLDEDMQEGEIAFYYVRASSEEG